MQTSQYKIAGFFHIFHRFHMVSPPRIPSIVFSVETKSFFGPKHL